MNFLKHLPPERRAAIEARRRNFEEDVAEFKAMPVEQLCERTAYYLKNCEFPNHWQPGEPVYDGVIAHVIIPELLRRLKEGAA